MRKYLKTLLIAAAFTCAVQSGYPQDTSKVTAKQTIGFSVGAGFSDLLNLKLRIPIKQAGIALGAGFIPIKDETVSSFMADFYYHFAGHSEYTFVHPWFFRLGLNFLNDKTDSHTTKDLLLGIRLGREMNITRSFGIDVDAGAGFTLSHSVTGDVIDVSPAVWPMINTSFFFRF